MINAKGETIYTSAEIAYELGISPATVNAVGKRLFGNRIPHWTLNDARLICEYVSPFLWKKILNALPPFMMWLTAFSET